MRKPKLLRPLRAQQSSTGHWLVVVIALLHFSHSPVDSTPAYVTTGRNSSSHAASYDATSEPMDDFNEEQWKELLPALLQGCSQAIPEREMPSLQTIKELFVERVEGPEVCRNPFFRCLMLNEVTGQDTGGRVWWAQNCVRNITRGLRMFRGPMAGRRAQRLTQDDWLTSARAAPYNNSSSAGHASGKQTSKNKKSTSEELKRPTRSSQTRRRGSSNSSNNSREKKIAKLIKKANCSPKKTFVALPKEPMEHIEPCMVEVKRCSGCSGHEAMECVPTRLKIRKFPVYTFRSFDVTRSGQTKLQAPDDNSRMIVTKSVVEHTHCEPQCKVKKEHCKRKQSHENCQCICLTPTICRRDQVYNQDLCECRCKTVTRCSSGTTFNHTSCSCTAS